MYFIIKNKNEYIGIIKEHNNDNLTLDGLGIILFRNHKVSDAASHVAARVFLDNAKRLGLLNDENIFSIDNGAKEASQEEILEELVAATHKPLTNDEKKKEEVFYLPPAESNENETKQKKYNSPPIPVFVDDEGNVAEVYLPKGFNKAHIERIIKVLTAQIA